MMPSTETITAKITSLPADAPDDHPATDRVGQDYEVSKELPSNVDEAVEMWGSEVVFSRLRGAVVIDLQSFVRTKIKSKDFTEESLQAAVDAWSPGTRGPGVSMETKAENLMAAMTPDQLQALLDRVEARKSD
jgi:hypothetical protein